MLSRGQDALEEDAVAGSLMEARAAMSGDESVPAVLRDERAMMAATPLLFSARGQKKASPPSKPTRPWLPSPLDALVRLPALAALSTSSPSSPLQTDADKEKRSLSRLFSSAAAKSRAEPAAPDRRSLLGDGMAEGQRSPIKPNKRPPQENAPRRIGNMVAVAVCTVVAVALVLGNHASANGAAPMILLSPMTLLRQQTRLATNASNADFTQNVSDGILRNQVESADKVANVDEPAKVAVLSPLLATASTLKNESIGAAPSLLLSSSSPDSLKRQSDLAMGESAEQPPAAAPMPPLPVGAHDAGIEPANEPPLPPSLSEQYATNSSDSLPQPPSLYDANQTASADDLPLDFFSMPPSASQANATMPPAFPPAAPSPLPTPPPPSVAEVLNARFREGRPSNDLSVAGVLISQFDILRDSEKPWLPCTGTAWCARYGDRFPGSVISRKASGMYSKYLGGLVLDPTSVSLFCSYFADGSTQGDERRCDPPGQSANCTPGCYSYGKPIWCESRLQYGGCAWRPDELEQMTMQQLELSSKYNELVFDPEPWVEHLPTTVQAFFFRSTSGPKEEAQARRVHAAFLQAYADVDGAADTPLLVYNEGEHDAPFSLA